MKKVLAIVLIMWLVLGTAQAAEARGCRHRSGIPSRLTNEQARVHNRIHKVFPSGVADYFVRVAWGESRLSEYPKDHRNRNGSIDVGTFQINLTAHGRYIRSHGFNVRDPEGNVQFSYDLYRRAGKGPWC